MNRELRDKGFRLWHSPELVVCQGRSAGLRLRPPASRPRPDVRAPAWATLLDGAKPCGSPAAVIVPFVLVARTFREVFSGGAFV